MALLASTIGVEAVHAQQTFHVLLRHLYEFDTHLQAQLRINDCLGVFRLDRWSRRRLKLLEVLGQHICHLDCAS